MFLFERIKYEGISHAAEDFKVTDRNKQMSYSNTFVSPFL